MATASHFEQSMTDAVRNCVERVAGKNHPLTWLVTNKAISRQYHTRFDWQAEKANQFFGLFGDTFKKSMQEKIQKDDNLNSSIQAFMEIGRERNRLVHQDFGNFSLEKTSKEMYARYSEARRFVEWFPEILRRFTEEGMPAD